MQNPYDMEIQRVIQTIQDQQPKTVCLQLPDGLKPFAKDVVDTLQDACPGVRFVIWGQSNFGACDIPIGLDIIKTDLLVSFGHSPWVWGDELKRY
ncbi:MAG: diphthamide synthesis protein [Candidatus Woesearchaeota archaeon]